MYFAIGVLGTGGAAGLGNQVAMRIDGREIDDFPNAKVLTQHLKDGDAFTVLSGGGGGFGAPWKRDPDSVARDVVQEYVSPKAARDLYGVAIQTDGAVDPVETAALREVLSSNGGSHA